MHWNEYTRQAAMTFRTPAPADAPEVKGYRCYFRPEWLEWSVRPGEVRVAARGPATRVEHRQGDMWWTVESTLPHRGEDRPDWLTLPVDLLARANLAVQQVEAIRLALQEGQGNGDAD